MEVGKVGGEKGEGLIAGSRASDPFVNGRGEIVINLAASFRWRRNDGPLGFFVFFYSQCNLKNMKSTAIV